MGISKILKYFFIGFLWLCFQTGFTQNEFGSSEEMAEKAAELFQDEDYIQAFPLYSQLLSLDKGNPELSYRFGVCLLYSDRRDTYAPIGYLKKGLNQISDPEIYYHLGFAYHINYNFPAAISFYNDYKNKAGKKINPSFEVNRKIEMCSNGMKMMKSVKDLFVLDKNEVSRDEFFRSYSLQGYGGKMIRKPEDFLTKEDQKKTVNDFIFFNSKSEDVFYSAYSKQNKDQKDIYKRSKLPEGGWSEPERLPNIINTPYDDDYVVMMPDGKTMYFSSKGHNTIGGFDIFKTVYNAQNKSWSSPENVNFPFNTPVDDILFVSDTSEATAWFASVRSSVADKIMVYKVGIIKRPEGSDDLAAIYAKNKMLTEEDLRNIKDRASLDINISEEDYEEIPEVDHIAAAQILHQQNEEKIAADIESKKNEQVIIDSAKVVVSRFEENMDAFDSVRQYAVTLASNNRLEAHRLRDDVKQNMKLASSSSDQEGLAKVIQNSNYSLGKAEQLDYMAAELEGFADETQNKIDRQIQNFTILNKQYGDAENAVIRGDLDAAKATISAMKSIQFNAPKMIVLAENMPIYQGDNTNKQLPVDIQSANDFQAFEMKTEDANIEIVAIAPEFESYFPPKDEKEEVVAKKTTFSNNPSKKLEEYLAVLEEQIPSIDVLLVEKEQLVNEMVSTFSHLQEGSKIAELHTINEEQKVINELQSSKTWINEIVKQTRQELQNIQLSSVDPDEKFLAYQQMASELEKGYDFKTNEFHSFNQSSLSRSNKSITTDPIITQNTHQTLPSPAIIFVLKSNGEIAKQTIDSDHLIASSQISFNEASQDLLMAQSIQMISEVRNQNKVNTFGQRKLQQQISTLKNETQNSFSRAQELVKATKNASFSDKSALLEQTNHEFATVESKGRELDQLNTLNQQIETANIDANQISSKMTEQFEELESEIKKNNFEKVEQIYRDLVRDYNNHKVITDFSNEYDMNTGELINSSIQIVNNSIPAYQLNSQNIIVKSFGEASQGWTTVDEFIQDAVSGNNKLNLVLSPNVDLSSNEEKFTRIFKPSTEKESENFYLIKPKFTPQIRSSNNSLIQNTISQIGFLADETEFLLTKRNQLNKYYLKQIEEANELEQLSIAKVSSAKLSQLEIEEANKLSLESKKSFYKASVTASLIKQYDHNIVQRSVLIDESAETIQAMITDLDNNLQDEALVKNVQLQRKLAALDKSEVDDSAFNYSVNELFTPIPQIFSETENQEFLIENGQVQRNDQVKLNQFFYQNTPQIDVNIMTLPALSLGVPDIVENPIEETNLTITESTNSNQASLESTLSEVTNQVANQITNSTNNSASTTNTGENTETITDGVTISNPMDENSVAITENLILKSINVESFKTNNEVRDALGTLNLQAQAHMVEVDLMQKRLAVSAEEKLNKSNEFSLQLESINDPAQRRPIKDTSKKYLYQALALKEVSDNYQIYLNGEREIQNQITQYTFDIEKDLEQNDLTAAKSKFNLMKSELPEFSDQPELKLQGIQSGLIAQILPTKVSIDSAYKLSQDLANKSVKLLSEASEIRTEAEGKRNAFKRREALKSAEEKEIAATKFQNNSEKALALGNSLHEKQQILQSLSSIQNEVLALSIAPVLNNKIIINQELVFEGVENRKDEVFGRQVAINNSSVTNSSINQVEQSNTTEQTPIVSEEDLHVYERENFKAEMLSEELELIKREIALLVRSNNKNLSAKESYIVTQKVKILRQKADSLEYEANRVFDLADRILETLSEEEQKEAQKTSRDFNKYLSDLKDKIEILLSEASSLKQRAQRSNNIQTREDLYQQAKAKEEVAMYLILEEFEVIAQKNKTRYRKNQLVLEQIMMDIVNPEERELMRNIFAQIDDYFDQAQSKRQKANQPGISFSMKKILLQDAYSLEMKALDLQQQAKVMLEDHDLITMKAYQVETDEDISIAENTNNVVDNQSDIESANSIPEVVIVVPDNSVVTSPANTSQNTTTSSQQENEELIAENNSADIQNQTPQNNPIEEQEVEYISDSDNGVVYRVQFTALKELKNESFFNRVSDISAERVTGTDFIRYFSGNFGEMDAAIIRRNALRSSGYPDAFIRSWKNGEAVTLLSLREGTEEATTPINSVAAIRRTSVGNIDFSATNISSLQGVYYTVQVGVYSRPRTSAMIFGIKPLYHKRMQNGYWIYYSGIFNSIADATVKKDEIVLQGVKDAFVVAFNNGNSIGLAQARQQISRGVDTPDDEDIVILEDASLQIDSQWDMSQEAGITTSEDVKYKVQVGVYSNAVNLNWIASQLDGNYSVDSYQNSNGKYVYTIGDFNNDSSARDLLKEVQEIIPDAFLVGFQDGNKKYIR